MFELVKRCLPGLLLLLVPSTAFGQVTYGSIFGTVTDPTGAGVPNAKVVVTNTNTNTKTEVTTNADGNYSRGQLIAGPYRVEVESPGFRRTVSNDVLVSVDASARVDARLEVGNVSEQIEVTAEAPQLKSDRAEVAVSLSAKQLSELPSFNRNFQAYQLLAPGNSRLGFQHASSENPQGSVQIQVNGQHFSGTDWQLDGTSNQDPILGIIVINPTIDSVLETKLATQNYDAEFGLAAAGVQIITTKSGTNNFHGSLFEFLRNNTPGFSSFARNPFNSAEDRVVPPVKWNQFGGSLGGPVLKNKAFVFADAQLTRRRTGSSVLTAVPTALGRTGDLSEYLEPIPGAAMVQDTAGRMVPLQRNMIFDPLTGNTMTGVGRQAFADNRIPASRLSPQALRLIQQLPLPNSRDSGGSLFRRNYAATGSESFDSEQWNARADYFVDESSSIFARYSNAGFRKSVPGAFGDLLGGPALDNLGFAGQSDVINRSLAIGYNRTLSPSLITEFRFGYMRYRVDVNPNGQDTTPARDAGIPGLQFDDNPFTTGMPAFYLQGDARNNEGVGSTRFGYGLGVNQCNCPLAQKEQQYQIVNNTTKILGNHNLKFGADIRYALNLRVPSDDHRSGELEFANNYTGFAPSAGAASQQGYGLATYLLGQVTNFRRFTGTTIDAAERQKRFFFYGQDTWRVNSKLTLNYGLRWEMIFPETVNKAGNGGQLDLRTGEIAVFGVGQVSDHGIQEMKWTNFAPRFGVTYQLTPKTVVRAGYGWSYALGTFGSIFGHNVTQNLPVLARQNVNAPNDFSGVFSLAQGPPTLAVPVPDSTTGRFPLPNGVRGNARPLDVRLPRSMAYNFTVQHQLTSTLAVDAAYVGNVGRHVFAGDGPDINVNTPAFVPGVANTNQRRPFFNRFGWTQDILLYCNCATNRYDSLQINVDKRYSFGTVIGAHYTYQVGEGDDGDGYTFLYNRPLGRGNRDNLQRSIFSATVNAEIPFGKGRRFGNNMNRVFDALLGGWAANGITYYTSGRPFTPNIGDFPSGTVRPNAGPGGRPDEGDVSPYEGALGGREQYFKGGLGSAFLLPANNTFGNYPIRSLFGPRFINQDLSIFKSFRITESARFQLRAEAFNVFNHTNLGQPNDNVTNPEAGRITSLGNGAEMRRLQFGARIDF